MFFFNLAERVGFKVLTFPNKTNEARIRIILPVSFLNPGAGFGLSSLRVGVE